MTDREPTPARLRWSIVSGLLFGALIAVYANEGSAYQPWFVQPMIIGPIGGLGAALIVWKQGA